MKPLEAESRVSQPQPFISIVIPAHNEEKYLPACLTALARQNYSQAPYETIVVDNGSSDATPEVARQFGARLILEPIKGIARARQTGFDDARGEIIASTDADTIVPQDWLSRIAQHFAGDPRLGGVYGPVDWPDGRTHERFLMRRAVGFAMDLSNRASRSWWLGNNFAVRAEIFRAVAGFHGFDPEGIIGEDLFLSLKVDQVSKIIFDAELVVNASSRRAREGYINYLRRIAVSTARVAVLKKPALPHPDIR